ncbi:MAG: hypothetical protein IJ009_03340 [Clostridia bacterium]|nr:hypothetical protein [Clostridia bacterium]
MKKTLSLLVLAAMTVASLFGLSSCAKLDTTGLLEAAPDLIARSATLNEVFFGEGIPYNKGVTPVGNYYEADKDYLAEAGFSTVDELKAMTQEVFSAEYSAIIFETNLSGFAVEGSGYTYARYTSSQPEALRDENETILVFVGEGNQNPYDIGKCTYDYTTLALGKVSKKYAEVTLSVHTVFPPDEDHPDGYEETAPMTVRFVYEDGWHIDSPTY